MSFLPPTHGPTCHPLILLFSSSGTATPRHRAAPGGRPGPHGTRALDEMCHRRGSRRGGRRGSGGGRQWHRREGVTARGLGKIESNRFFCIQWHWWLITHQLHEEVHIGWFWSCKRGTPKLHLHLHYSSMELVAPCSFGAGVFG